MYIFKRFHNRKLKKAEQSYLTAHSEKHQNQKDYYLLLFLLMRLHSFLQACSVSKKSYTVLLLTGPLLMAIQVVSNHMLFKQCNNEFSPTRYHAQV